jgi:hypothetical protein
MELRSSLRVVAALLMVATAGIYAECSIDVSKTTFRKINLAVSDVTEMLETDLRGKDGSLFITLLSALPAEPVDLSKVEKDLSINGLFTVYYQSKNGNKKVLLQVKHLPSMSLAVAQEM